MEISLKIERKGQGTIAGSRGEGEVSLVYADEYREGDQILLEIPERDKFIILQVDDAMTPAFTYMTENMFYFPIPFGEKRVCYSPKLFSGEKHLLYAREAYPEEIKAYKNLALNPADQHANYGCFPHASANVETRGESVFAAKNAINGNRENHFHGAWPYESWGINMDDNAAMTIEFGRTVTADKIVLYTRSDFPHDNWWKQVTLVFSDGTDIEWDLEKSDQAHVLTFDKKEITWVRIEKLIKSDDPSPFPALTQMEVYGTEA